MPLSFINCKANFKFQVRQTVILWSAPADVFIASDFGISPLYLNNGDGTFTMHTVEAGLNIPGTGMGVDAGDYDLDWELDLFQSNFWWKPNSNYQGHDGC